MWLAAQWRVLARGCLCTTVCGLALSARFASGVTIDDFTVGPITVVGPTIQTQTGLDPAHVLSGSRILNVERSGSVLEVDPSVGLKFASTSNGYFDLKYDYSSAAQGVDLTQGGADRIRLVFEDISTPTFTPVTLFVTLPPNASNNGISLYVGNWDGVILEYPYSKFTVPMNSVQSINLDVWRNYPGASFVLKSITTAAPPLVGDYNRDGLVDSGDYAVWRQFVGISTRTNSVFPIASADGNADGRVDGADYIIWRRSAAGTGISVIANDLVPEPGAILLDLFALFTVGAVGTRCRNR
jgi:hypothetical protein